MIVFLVGGLSMIAFALHMFNVGADSLWWDETLSYHRANGGLIYVLSSRIALGPISTVDQHPPLYFALLSAMLALAGQSELVLRFSSVASTVVAVPVAYVAGRRVAGPTAGVAAAALWVSSPLMLWAAKEARPYALLALLSVLSVYLFLRAAEMQQARWVAGWMASLLALFSTHYMAAVFVACQVAIVTLYLLAQRSRRPLLLGGSLAFLTLATAPAVPFVLDRLRNLDKDMVRAPASTMAWDLANTFSFGEATLLLPMAILLPLLGASLAGSLLALLRRPAGLLWAVLAATLFLPVLAMYFLTSSGYLPYVTRYMTFLAPGYYLIVAVGIARWDEIRRAVAVALVAGLVAVGLLAVGHAQLRESYSQDLRGTSAHIVRSARQDDAVVLASPRVSTTLEYYGVGSLATYFLRTPRESASLEEVTKQLTAIGQRHGRLWILTDYWEHLGDAPILEILDRLFTPLEKTTFTRRGYAQDIYLYQASPRVVEQLPRDATATDARLGDAVRLVGYKVEQSSGRRGRIYLTLFWQPTAPLSRLRAFGELIDGHGRIWASFDGEPYGGFYPTTSWKPGEIVVDNRTLEAEPGTPPGSYTLTVGMRRWGGNDALTVVEPGQPPRESAPLGGLELTSFDPADGLALPSGATPLAASAGPVELVGVKAPFADRHPGESVPLRLYWKLPPEKLSLDRLSVRLALLSPDGRTVAADQRALLDHTSDLPTDQRALLAADYDIRIPRAADGGRYQVAVSLHDAGPGHMSFGTSWLPFAPRWVTVADVRVHGYERVYEVPSSSLSLNTAVGSIAALAAFVPETSWQSERDSGEAPVLRPASSPPTRLPVTLYWHARAETDQDLTAFVQLLDPSGRLVAQHDGTPQSGRRPTSTWLAREVIVDTHTMLGLEALRPGRYALIAGLYDARTGVRLATPAGDYVLLGHVLLP